MNEEKVEYIEREKVIDLFAQWTASGEQIVTMQGICCAAISNVRNIPAADVKAVTHRKCEFCSESDNFDDDNNAEDIISKPVNLGIIGKYTLDVYIQPKAQLTAYIGTAGGGKDLAKTKINYCPMCGRKL